MMEEEGKAEETLDSAYKRVQSIEAILGGEDVPYTSDMIKRLLRSVNTLLTQHKKSLRNVDQDAFNDLANRLTFILNSNVKVRLKEDIRPLIAQCNALFKKCLDQAEMLEIVDTDSLSGSSSDAKVYQNIKDVPTPPMIADPVIDPKENFKKIEEILEGMDAVTLETNSEALESLKEDLIKLADDIVEEEVSGLLKDIGKTIDYILKKPTAEGYNKYKHGVSWEKERLKRLYQARYSYQGEDLDDVSARSMRTYRLLDTVKKLLDVSNLTDDQINDKDDRYIELAMGRVTSLIVNNQKKFGTLRKGKVSEELIHRTYDKLVRIFVSKADPSDAMKEFRGVLAEFMQVLVCTMSGKKDPGTAMAIVEECIQQIPDPDLSKISEDEIKYGEKLGKGSYGVVYQARTFSQTVAVKLSIHTGKPDIDQITVWDLRDEVKMLRELRHPNIAETYGVVHTGDRYGIIMEFAEHGSLYQYIKNNPPVEWNEAIGISLDISKGIEFIHRMGYLHRDLKLENILMTANGIKIADPGFMIRVELAQLFPRPGTRTYRPPEILSGKQGYYTPEGEVYTMSLVLWEVAHWRPTEASKKALREGKPQGLKKDSMFSKDVPEDVRKPVEEGLQLEAKGRPNAFKMVEHYRALYKKYREKQTEVKAEEHDAENKVGFFGGKGKKSESEKTIESSSGEKFNESPKEGEVMVEFSGSPESSGKSESDEDKQDQTVGKNIPGGGGK